MNPASIELRYEARADDLAAVRSIVDSTQVFSPVEVEVAIELVEDRLRHGSKSDYHFAFADCAGRTIGYTCYGPVAIALTAASYDLYWIAVDKARQGRRIGQMLMQRTEDLIREAGGRQVYIETSSREPYAPTRGFYLRAGYVEAAVLQDFYAPGDHKVIYVRNFDAHN